MESRNEQYGERCGDKRKMEGRAKRKAEGRTSRRAGQMIDGVDCVQKCDAEFCWLTAKELSIIHRSYLPG